MLNKLEDLNKSGPFPAGTLLVSWDVVSMFPNINNNLGLTAVRKALNARENKFPSMTCILEAVKICLKSNHSVFKENFFLQIHGTAMGPKNACSYADLAMGEIDVKAKFLGPYGGDIVNCIPFFKHFFLVVLPTLLQSSQLTEAIPTIPTI